MIIVIVIIIVVLALYIFMSVIYLILYCCFVRSKWCMDYLTGPILSSSSFCAARWFQEVPCLIWFLSPFIYGLVLLTYNPDRSGLIIACSSGLWYTVVAVANNEGLPVHWSIGSAGTASLWLDNLYDAIIHFHFSQPHWIDTSYITSIIPAFRFSAHITAGKEPSKFIV